MKPETSLLVIVQLLKSSYVLFAGAFFKLLLVDVPNAGPWNCVILRNVCVIGPYSPQWYSFYHFSALAGYTPEITLFCMIDSLIILTIGRVERLSYSLIASSAGFFFLFYDPADLLIYWLALLSRGHWFMSITATLTKLPIFAPLNIWNYILTISLPQDSPGFSLSTFRYLVLAGFALQPIWKKIYARI